MKKKIPFTRLKIARIERIEILELPGGLSILKYMKEHKDFVDVSSGLMPVEFMISPSMFTEMSKELPDLPEETLNTLTYLNKQFISFDYIMII